MTPEWISSCSASETSCGGDNYEHNNECWAVEVSGQDWSSEVVALFLEDWELGRVALCCLVAVDLLCQEMRDACWVSAESLPVKLPCRTVTATKPFPHIGRVVTIKEKDVVREIKKGSRNVSGEPC